MPISKASGPVQAAVYTLLNGDATLTGLRDYLGDSVPEGTAAKRSIAISVVSEVRDRRLATGAGGHASRLLVSVTSRAEDTQDRTGSKSVQAIDQRVVELLDNATLAVAGWTFVSCDYVDSTAQQDGAWRQLVADFEILVEDT